MCKDNAQPDGFDAGTMDGPCAKLFFGSLQWLSSALCEVISCGSCGCNGGAALLEATQARVMGEGARFLMLKSLMGGDDSGGGRVLSILLAVRPCLGGMTAHSKFERHSSSSRSSHASELSRRNWQGRTPSRRLGGTWSEVRGAEEAAGRL